MGSSRRGEMESDELEDGASNSGSGVAFVNSRSNGSEEWWWYVRYIVVD
jgi:hypothetical protein